MCRNLKLLEGTIHSLLLYVYIRLKDVIRNYYTLNILSPTYHLIYIRSKDIDYYKDNLRTLKIIRMFISCLLPYVCSIQRCQIIFQTKISHNLFPSRHSFSS